MRPVHVLLTLIALQGCAFTDATLTASHDVQNISEGPLSELDSQSLALNEFVDAREDQERIGYKRNGFGAKTADVTSERPVTTIVASAIKDAFVINGHDVGADLAGFSISGVVNQFWVETDVNFSNVEVTCDIEADLSFTDTASDESFYRTTYRGTFSDSQGMVTDKLRSNVIGGALQALVDDVIFDEDLAEAIADR